MELPASNVAEFKNPESVKTHYDLLGIQPAAAADEVKRAFRREIARYHPDKVQHLGPEFQEIAATRAAELTEAYRVLMDTQLRERYDAALQEHVPTGANAAARSTSCSARTIRLATRAARRPTEAAHCHGIRPTRSASCGGIVAARLTDAVVRAGGTMLKVRRFRRGVRVERRTAALPETRASVRVAGTDRPHRSTQRPSKPHGRPRYASAPRTRPSA